MCVHPSLSGVPRPPSLPSIRDEDSSSRLGSSIYKDIMREISSFHQLLCVHVWEGGTSKTSSKNCCVWRRMCLSSVSSRKFFFRASWLVLISFSSFSSFSKVACGSQTTASTHNTHTRVHRHRRVDTSVSIRCSCSCILNHDVQKYLCFYCVSTMCVNTQPIELILMGSTQFIRIQLVLKSGWVGGVTQDPDSHLSLVCQLEEV